jgi:tetratricopeptide (TPR) repeat protein
MVLNLFVLVALLLGESDPRWRVLYSFASLAVGAATFTSLTRAAWLGAVVGAVAFAVFAVRLKPKVTLAEKILALALVAVIAGAAVVSMPHWDPDSNVGRRVASAFDPHDKNTLGRTETWRIAAVAVGKRPIFGYGPDTFPLAFEPNETEAFARLVAPDIVQANAHSAPVQLATESGIPGLLLWLALLGVATVVAVPLVMRREAKAVESRLMLGGALASVAGYVAASLLSPSSPPLGLLFWCMLACLVSPAATRLEPGRTRNAAAIVAITLGTCAALVAVTFLYADTRAATADDETVAIPARIAAADAAVALDPLSAEDQAVAAKAYAQAGLQAASAGTPDRARLVSLYDKAYAAMQRAVTLEPTNPRRRSTLVSLLLIGGASVDKRYYSEAVAVAEEARRAAPNDLDLAYWCARALVADGRSPQAVPLLERALGLRPGYGDAAILLSDLYVGSGDQTRARSLLERTIPVVADPQPLQMRLDRLNVKATGS